MYKKIKILKIESTELILSESLGEDTDISKLILCALCGS